MKTRHKIFLAVLFLLAGLPALAASVGIVQRWHGTIEADNILVQHLIGGGQAAVATPVAGTGCNTPSAAVATGSDVAGQVGFTCGGTGSTAVPILTLTFKTAYQNNAICAVTPANQATALIPVAQLPFTSGSSKTALIITSSSTGLATGTYLWNYSCHDRLP